MGSALGPLRYREIDNRTLITVHAPEMRIQADCKPFRGLPTGFPL
jgi:hypothetical protein